MKSFLIVFDRKRGRVLDEREFSDAQEALRERFVLERHYRGQSTIEIVVLGAVDKAALRRTHRRYFADVAALTRLALDTVEAPPQAAAH